MSQPEMPPSPPSQSPVNLPRKGALDRSFDRLNLVGYVILAYTFLQLFTALFPLRLLQPDWGFQLLGQWVQQVWGLLVGFALVFFRHRQRLTASEFRLLQRLSQSCLLLAIVYFLMVPWGILNTFRLNSALSVAYSNQLAAQTAQFDQLLTQIEGADPNSAQFQQMAKQLETLSVEEVADRLLAQVETEKQQAQQQLAAQQQQQRQTLWRNSINWNLGALLIGVAFVWFWRLTGDYRQDDRQDDRRDDRSAQA